MLRVIKQKANDGLLNSSAVEPAQSRNSKQNESALADSTRNLISHAPSYVSLGGSVISSNCSIVSDKPVDAQRASIVDEDNDSTVVNSGTSQAQPLHKDSSKESKNTDATLPAAEEAGVGIQTDSASRKVSFSQSELGTASDYNPKRPRLDSCSPVSTDIMPVAAESRLLTMPEDASVLNSLHLFIRAQIEVFTATPADIAMPSPGRKIPIQMHQVGLRCIHCSHLPTKNRIKRAVCYPSSVGRVYNSVSDMKFDHFNNCRGFPPVLRAKLRELLLESKKKVEGGRKPVRRSVGCSSSTAQYYHDAARKMGMVDGNGRIFMVGPVCEGSLAVPSQHAHEDNESPTTGTPARTSLHESTPQSEFPRQLPNCFTPFPYLSSFAQDKLTHGAQPSWFAMFVSTNDLSKPVTPTKTPIPREMVEEQSHKPIPLAMPEDAKFLNPLHCWVRCNIELFAATQDDLSVPAPGRKTRVLIGQVGIRCIQCAKLTLRDRVKRGVCYPPSVSGIYHSVSNMKFDHFGNCRGLSPEARAEFAKLKACGNRRGGGGTGNNGSTAQYYHDSALQLGLVDTDQGIRFADARGNAMTTTTTTKADPPSQASALQLPEGKNVSDGISALMYAATNASASNYVV